ncbi:SH3 domain-containing protein [Bacillus thuringiensis]|uniref:SH3 domain-containing protein n=1 Tax=Bacillus thuringiensis TaxID=1428 RepID=UPI0021D65324|nr:SH3 domain-containing protein [Bacillus thuringiensis]MCU7666737.1 SH3 domain-containing protein [Bacillus thuringiensis]
MILLKSKKMILAVFLGLLASAAALISALFMLQQLKSISTLPKEVDNLRKSIEAISVEVDVSPLNKRIDDVVKHVNELGATVESVRANELATIQPNTQQPNIQNPNTQTNIQPNTQQPNTNPVTPSPITPPKPVEPNKPIKEVEKPKEQPKPKEHKETTKTTKTTNRLNLRSKPGLKTSVVKVTSNGEKLTIIGDAVEKDGYKWVNVRDSKGNTGWIVQKYTH